MSIAKFLHNYPGYTIETVLQITLRRYLLFLDAIRYLQEDRNRQLLSIEQYLHAKKKSDRDLFDTVLFPVSSLSKRYIKYEDDGKGFQQFKKLVQQSRAMRKQ